MAENLTPKQAREAILAGKVVRVVVGTDPDDPILLNYLDRCSEDSEIPMIYTEAIGGWSQGVKEPICEVESDFYANSFLADVESITLTDQEPFMREIEEG